MSVYTEVNSSQLKQFFSYYTLGEVISFEGIEDGINNTNYFVDTTQGRFVLTLFETLSIGEIPYFTQLLSFLAKNDISCPEPQLDQSGQLLRQLNNKPAVLFKRLSGSAILTPSIEHCQEIGHQLAKVHDCTQNYAFPIGNSHDLNGCIALAEKIDSQLSASDRVLIQDELLFQAAHNMNDLPLGVIHGDLFRDNVLFLNNKVSGILDFYSAFTGILLLDVAITVNDWCHENDQLNSEKIKVLLSAYQALRPLLACEKQHWQVLLRASALRFWLSRLEHQLYPRPGNLILQKDPLQFRQLLQQHRLNFSVNSIL